MKGCELCPGSEDVWLEAARLQTPDHAKALLARGVAANPTSIKLWMQACASFRLVPGAVFSFASAPYSCAGKRQRAVHACMLAEHRGCAVF